MSGLDKKDARVIWAMANGHFLKSHRDIDGHKAYLLHPPQGKPVTIPRAVVDSLRRQGLIDSNKKFPVATFWLTEKGRSLAAMLP
jgi:hypothetical protein